MSELKAFEVTGKALFGRFYTKKVYDKDEADKVIAEKDAKILALEAEVAKQKHHAKLFFDERNHAETQLRHSNHKRCLAIAKICECRTAYTCGRRLRHNLIWRERWLKLAEKFKEKK